MHGFRHHGRPVGGPLAGLVVALVLAGVVEAGKTVAQTRAPAAALHVRLQARLCAVASPDVMAGAEEVITRRIQALGVRGPRVTTVGRCGIDVVATGVTNQRQFIAIVSATGHLVVYGMGTLPRLKAGAPFPYPNAYNLCTMATSPSPCIVITGADLDRSTIGVGHDSSGAPAVNASIRGVGAYRSSAYMGAHIRHHMTIVLDGTVIADPTIRAQLSTDWQITGLRSVKEATTIAFSLKYGALPIAFTVVRG